MVNFSILTNNNAQIALANLNGINVSLSKVESQVSTGLRVSSATDNMAVFTVAQGIRAKLQGYSSANSALNDVAGLVQTDLAAITSISNLIGSITQTLTQLSQNTLSDTQRQIYTGNLKSQIDEVQTFINDANYNGQNLIAAQQGTQGINFSNYTAPANLSVLAGPDGNLLNITAINLSGGTAGTDGFWGLARLVYQVGTLAAVDSGSDGSGTSIVGTLQSVSATTISSVSNGNSLSTPFGIGYGNDTNSNSYVLPQGGALVSRSELSAAAAIAALSAVSNANSAFSTSDGAAGGASVFGGAIAFFNQQISAALGLLGNSANNIQLQLTFNQSLTDAVNTGLSNLVDANLAQASALLTALQTQQKLATQTLSIANSEPAIVLRLFH